MPTQSSCENVIKKFTQDDPSSRLKQLLNPTADADRAIAQASVSARDALLGEKLRAEMRQHMLEPGQLLTREAGTFGSDVGEPQVKAVEALSRARAADSVHVREGGSMSIFPDLKAVTPEGKAAKKAFKDFEKEFIDCMGGREALANDLHEIASSLQQSATEARQAIKDDGIGSRVVRTVSRLVR